MKHKEIKLHVEINEGEHVPEAITWQATDMSQESLVPAKAFMLSLWDKDQRNTLKIDMWTRDMTIDEMKQFFHQSLLSMSESFLKATGEKNIVEDLRDYCHHFAEKMKLKSLE